MSRRFLRAFPCPARIIAAVVPLVFVLLGVAALTVGSIILRSFGPGFRVGRLLSTTPIVPVAEALRLADGRPRYIGVRGRVDAVDGFEDDAHRPLVLRRARLQVLLDGRWDVIDDHLEAVDFTLDEGLDSIAIDRSVLGAGLVVVPRESVGTVADAPDRMPPGLDPSLPLRLRVEQVSSIEHAMALGVPMADASGSVHLTAGLGRPLVLTTLEPAEAMRILAAGERRRPMAAAIALVGGLTLLAVGLLLALLSAATGAALAASPSPSLDVAGGDPRSSGQGPGLVGDPLFAIGLVLAIGLGSALLTLAYVRLTGGRRA